MTKPRLTKEIMLTKTFGRLKVIDETEVKDLYVCECECGEVAEIYKANLASGRTKSCGCLARELQRERGK